MMAVIVAMLVWEIRQNYSDLEREVAERRVAQEKREDLTQTLERRVADHTQELSDVNKLLQENIAERKKRDRALLQANKKLNILSSITRHDILNKLTALVAFLELSKENAGGDEKMLH
jgi:C4-dicarboxylate-specific signal transduction histidine kinase